MRIRTEQHGTDVFSVAVPENDAEEEQLKQNIQDFLTQNGQQEQYDLEHEGDGRWVASSLTGDDSQYFSVRVDANGDPQVHDDGDSDY